MTLSRSAHLLLGTAAALSLIVLANLCDKPARAAGDSPAQYTADGKLILPTDYREWVFLSSGLDMSYTPNAPMGGGVHMFNNVFVPRAAYEAFLKTGHWPDKTVLMLENRGGMTNRSILKHGMVQTTDVMALEVHVKDTARFKGGWGFFAFDSDKPAKQIPYTADCYSCHEAHGAVGTTFVQFYPTLFGVATQKNTLSAGYLADQKAAHE